MDSFLPNWISFAPRYSGCAPRSIAAVVNAERVRVDVFQIKAQYFFLLDSDVGYHVFQVFQVF